jgi:hypothetical protein
MDREKYRYQKFISDLAGVDIEAHGNNPEDVLAHVRDWLRNTPGKRPAMGSNDLKGLYRKFCAALPDIAKELGQSTESLTFPDFEQAVTTWLQESR